MIYGISKDWNLQCWLVDSLASSLMKATDDATSVSKLGRLVRLVADTFDYLNGPSVIKQLLAKLITRNVRKLRFLIRNQILSGILSMKDEGRSAKEEEEYLQQSHWTSLGVSRDFVTKHIGIADKLKAGISSDHCLFS